MLTFISNHISYFVAPLVGGVIGYITNDIAIRMLFRPHKPKYLFGKQLPFTPGIMPKEKSRLAASIGDSISQNLINREVLEKSLLSDEMIGKITQGFDRFVADQKANNQPLRAFLGRFLTADDMREIAATAQGQLSTVLCKKLASSSLGDKVAAIVVKRAIEKMTNNFLNMLGANKVLDLISGPAESLLAKNINSMLADNGHDMVDGILERGTNELLDAPVSRLLAGHDEELEQLKHYGLSMYRTVITTHLPKILRAVSIETIIEQRINEMDIAETEAIIRQVMDKELRAIVWLGALLGTIMGCINCLF